MHVNLFLDIWIIRHLWFVTVRLKAAGLKPGGDVDGPVCSLSEPLSLGLIFQRLPL